MKKKDLIKCFEIAKAGAEFIGININTPAGNETIVIGKESFDSKLEFYKNAYNEDLIHCMNDKVRIINLTPGKSFSEIQEILIEN